MKKITDYKTYNRRLTGSKKLRHRLFFFLYRLVAAFAVPICLFIGAGAAIFFLLLQYKHADLPPLPAHPNECDGFRRMRLEPELTDSLQRLMAQTDTDKYRLLALLMASTGFYDTTEEQPYLPSTLEEYDALAAYYEAEYPEELALLQSSYETILSDIVYFPVMKSSRNNETGLCGADISYADAWLAERNYQNTSHSHEGTDIMALNNRRGYYPIVSMTDGVVENIGWLEKGGYRIGIRSPHGGYFYYAHLYRYADGLAEGSQIQAGQLLGFMGDSGYSKVEGTVGNFDVHLHFGIYLKTEHYEELSVNPYWILKLVESSTVVGDY